MTLREVYEYENRFHKDIQLVGVYDPVTEMVNPIPIDKYLETNAEDSVEDYQYDKDHKCIVIFK